MTYRCVLFVLPFLLIAFTLTAVSCTAAQQLQTPGEEADYNRHTSHEEMVEYLYEVKAETSDMVLGQYGTTLEGRELMYGIFSRNDINSPAEAHASGKPVVVLSANVHGHNFILREALLIMARELGTPGTELNELLDDIIVILAPSKNPDALVLEDRFSPLGADFNRDYIMLEQPGMEAFIGNIINKWNPHIMVDGHDGGAAQYGGSYPYDLLHQASAIAAADQSITRLADERVFPYLNERMEEEGYRTFYWARGDEEAYYGGGHSPRMGRNYGGLANKLSILFEHADWHDFQTGIESGIVAFTGILEYAAEYSDELIETIESARNETIRLGKNAEGQIPVKEEMVADDFRVTYDIMVDDDPDDVITIEDAEIIKKPEGTAFRGRPWAYVLPPDAFDAVKMLKRHNIRVEKTKETVSVEATAYRMGGVDYEDTDNNHRSALLLEVESEVQDHFEIPKGSFLIPTGQLLGRLASHMLEPETTDNVFYWNRMTPHIPIAEFHSWKQEGQAGDAPLLPLRKLMEEKEIPGVAF